MSRALIIVDVQPTFCEGGALPVEGGNSVAEAIAHYVRTHGDDYEMVATTQDWHIDPGPHFSEHPDFVDTWPPHALAGTSDAQLHPALAQVSADPHVIHVLKGAYEAAYSGFEGRTEQGESLADALHEAGISSVDVVGLALSHCVAATALDALAEGFEVRVLEDLSAPVTSDLGRQAVARMREAGVLISHS